MIFSADNWNKAEEISRFVPVSSGLSFKKFDTPLQNAFNLFIVPLLGDEMTARLIAIYQNRADEATATQKIESKLLGICQRANANLAFWYDFDEINLHITDKGIQRQESENGSYKSPYKYQENNLRANFRNKGFNALDEMLAFLERHAGLFPEYLQSPACLDSRQAIVRNTEEVNKVYFINNSRIIYLRLQAHFAFAEENILRPALGEVLYGKLLAWLAKAPADETERLKVEELRIKSGKVIVMNAVKRLMAETGSLTDRGLYFSSITANRDGDENEKPVTDNRLSIQIAQAESDAKVYMNNLVRFVKRAYPDDYAGNPRQAFHRDNDHKKTFFA